MKNKNTKKIWIALLLGIIILAAVILLILHPWSKDAGTAENAAVPAVTAAEPNTAEANAALGQADQEAAAAAEGDQQSIQIEDSTGLIDTIRLQDTIQDSQGGGPEGVYSIHLKDTANWGASDEADKETALAVIKEVMAKRASDGYGSCVIYAYQANNCMAFMWFEFNPQYLSMFDAQGNSRDVAVLTDEQVTSVGATIPQF